MVNAESEEIVDAVQTLLDLSTSTHYDYKSEENFVKCHICGEWEGHTDVCFVPVLEKWMATPGEFVKL